MYKLIVSGSSTTTGGWPTWKDFVTERYNIDITDVSGNGQGNELIIYKAILAAENTENPILSIMLSSVDKWDWYVEDKDKILELNQEKHKIRKTHKKDSGGYWSTGSWFPLYKEYYKEHYYSLNYQVIKTCMMIHHLTSFCQNKNIPYLVLFDSPIFEYTEQELNNNPSLETKTLINDTTYPFYKMINHTINDRGLIGYCSDNGIPWFHEKYRSHPSSLAHYQYAKDVVFPKLDKFFTVVKEDQMDYASKMDKLWYRDIKSCSS